jgi:hypothetical protein
MGGGDHSSRRRLSREGGQGPFIEEGWSLLREGGHCFVRQWKENAVCRGREDAVPPGWEENTVR